MRGLVGMLSPFQSRDILRLLQAGATQKRTALIVGCSECTVGIVWRYYMEAETLEGRTHQAALTAKALEVLAMMHQHYPMFYLDEYQDGLSSLGLSL